MTNPNTTDDVSRIYFLITKEYPRVTNLPDGQRTSKEINAVVQEIRDSLQKLPFQRFCELVLTLMNSDTTYLEKIRIFNHILLWFSTGRLQRSKLPENKNILLNDLLPSDWNAKQYKGYIDFIYIWSRFNGYCWADAKVIEAQKQWRRSRGKTEEEIAKGELGYPVITYDDWADIQADIVRTARHMAEKQNFIPEGNPECDQLKAKIEARIQEFKKKDDYFELSYYSMGR